MPGSWKNKMKSKSTSKRTSKLHDKSHRSNSRLQSGSKDCKRGMIYRKGYSRKIGTKQIKISGNCIKATSQSGLKRNTQEKKYFRAKLRSQTRAKKLTRGKSKSCSNNQIKRSAYERRGYTRKAYVRKDGTKVKGSRISRTVIAPGCTNARGLSKSKSSSKSRQLFHLEKGVLGKYGYKNIKQKTIKQRRASLGRALTDGIKPLPLFRRVNALYVLNKNQDPILASKLKKDRDYIKTTISYKNRNL
jgi:hypothetical protein